MARKMNLSILKCAQCNRARLVDNVYGKWICFACKQKIGKVGLRSMGEERGLFAVAQ